MKNILHSVKKLAGKHGLLIMLLFMGQPLLAQVDPMLSQQWFSRINRNPAATGNSSDVDIFLLTRQQWVGFDGSPESYLMNVQRTFEGINSGFGVTMDFDKLGVSHNTFDARLVYNYQVKLSQVSLLSLGISGGVYNTYTNPNNHRLVDVTDPIMPTDTDNELRPDFGVGAEFATNRLTLGAAFTHLFTSHSNATTVLPPRQFYAYGRYRFSLGNNFDLAPAIAWANDNKVNEMEYSLTAFFKKKIWLGVDFRPEAGLGAIAGVELGKLRIGYAYEYSLEDVQGLSQNTHEVMLQFLIPTKKK